MKPPLRIKSVSTKVSEEEFAGLESRARARKLTLSEWVRAELLEPRGGESGAGTEVLLGEVLALRTILINLLFSLTNGKPVTPEAMRELIEKADGDKERRAMALLPSSTLLTTLPHGPYLPRPRCPCASHTSVCSCDMHPDRVTVTFPVISLFLHLPSSSRKAAGRGTRNREITGNRCRDVLSNSSTAYLYRLAGDASQPKQNWRP